MLSCPCSSLSAISLVLSCPHCHLRAVHTGCKQIGHTHLGLSVCDRVVSAIGLWVCRSVSLYVPDCVVGGVGGGGGCTRAALSETLLWFCVEREEKEIQALAGSGWQGRSEYFFLSYLDSFQNFLTAYVF